MPAAPAVQREPVALVVVTVLPVTLMILLPLRGLAAGDEGRQPIDVATVLAASRLELPRGLIVVVLRLLLVLRKGLALARQIGLRFARTERSVAHDRLAFVLVVETIITRAALNVVFGADKVGIVLAELFLCGGDQAVVVLSVLIIVFSGDRVARRLRVARKLNVFFGNVGGISPDLDVGTVRFVDARQRIVALAVAVAVVVIAATHALVLTVSHDSPVR